MIKPFVRIVLVVGAFSVLGLSVAGPEEDALRIRLATTFLPQLLIQNQPPEKAIGLWKAAVEEVSGTHLNVLVQDKTQDDPGAPVSLELRDVSALDSLKFLSSIPRATVSFQKNVVFIELL